MKEMDHNAHSVYLLHYYLVMVVKYRRKVIDNPISDRASKKNADSLVGQNGNTSVTGQTDRNSRIRAKNNRGTREDSLQILGS